MSSGEAMRERFMLITGGTDGIGKAMAFNLAQQGVRLTLVGRNAQRGEQTVKAIRATSGNPDVHFLSANMSLMRSVRELADEYRRRRGRLDVLVHCAGSINLRRTLTDEGIELNFATNYLGRFLLTELLQDMFVTSDAARLVILGTAGMQPLRFYFDGLPQVAGLSGVRAYQQSQAANDVWGIDLSDRFADRRIAVTVVNPGIVRTNIRRQHDGAWWLRLLDLIVAPFALTTEDGAITPVYLASATDAQKVSGQFFGPKRKVLRVPDKAYDLSLRTDLRRVSEKLTDVCVNVKGSGADS